MLAESEIVPFAIWMTHTARWNQPNRSSILLPPPAETRQAASLLTSIAKLCSRGGLLAGEKAIDLAEFFGRERQVLQGGDVVVHLLHFAGADQRAGHARIAQHPCDSHLGKGLSALLRYRVQIPEHRYLALINVFSLQEKIACGARVAGNSLQIAVREQSLRKRAEDDTSHAFFAEDIQQALLRDRPEILFCRSVRRPVVVG